MLKQLWLRFLCLVKSHDYGETVRTDKSTPWYETEYLAPVTGAKIRCYRRRFIAHQTCLSCQVVKFIEGYDQKPHETDPFENAKKTKENSPVCIITQEHAHKLFPHAFPKA